jgi:hypothetical protein
MKYRHWIEKLISGNPLKGICRQTKGIQKEKFQIYELYSPKAQLEARSHPNMLTVQSALNET